MAATDQVTGTPTPHSTWRVNYKIVSASLVLLAVGMLLIWQPWQKPITTDRTISVTGESTLRAAPDEYVFSPSYTFTNADSKAALAQMTAKSDEIVSKLKALGVTDSAIKTNSSGSSGGGGGIYYYSPIAPNGGSTDYTLGITVTLDSTKLLQPVQDYLVTTSPTGSVSPSATFSTAKQHSLENQARNLAEKDARSKADQSAANLGFKVAAVKTVEDGTLDGPILYNGANVAAGVASTVAKAPTLTVQPGQNDLTYSVSVVYFIH